MKNRIIYIVLLILSAGLCACEEDDLSKDAVPDIQISESDLSFEGLNVGDELSIPIEVSSNNGLKRFSYFFITKNANGTESTDAVNFDDDSFPESMSRIINFEVISNMVELVVVAFDRHNTSAEKHIFLSDIRSLPQIIFKDNIDYRETVFENKRLEITGQVLSEFKIESMSYSVIKNNQVALEQSLSFTENTNNVDFAFQVLVEKGLQSIVVKADNIYKGQVVDTFRIGSVVEDAVSITMQNGMSEIERLYSDKPVSISGMVSSGSQMKSLSYAVKNNGSYGSEVAIPLGTPLDEFPFTIQIQGQRGTDAVRISGENENGNTQVVELAVKRIVEPLIYRQDVELTTEIGQGKSNWFAAYQSPYSLDQQTAQTYQQMVDFMVFMYNDANVRISSAAVFQAGSYAPKVAPYMEGFNQATYSVITSNRPCINAESFGALDYDEDIETFVEDKIIASKENGGESYNVKVTNRRTSSNLVASSGFLVGWGSYDGVNAANKEFAIIFIKDVAIENGVGSIKFDIKYPKQNYRTKYNPVSILSYP